jgi:hypothetical protein
MQCWQFSVTFAGNSGTIEAKRHTVSAKAHHREGGPTEDKY